MNSSCHDTKSYLINLSVYVHYTKQRIGTLAYTSIGAHPSQNQEVWHQPVVLFTDPQLLDQNGGMFTSHLKTYKNCVVNISK